MTKTEKIPVHEIDTVDGLTVVGWFNYALVANFKKNAV